MCISILALARSSIIDDWDMPWELGAVFITMLLYIIYAEVLLQRGAEQARTKAINQLSKKISEERNKTTSSSPQFDENVIKRIESEIENIRELRAGAFKPWYEWSLLQSFGGLGALVALIQYFESGSRIG